MNRRNFLTAAIAAPAVVTLPSVVEAAVSDSEFAFDVGAHKPLTDEDRAAIDSISDDEVHKIFKKAFASRRLGSMAGRCDAAYTMGACFGIAETAVDASYVKSLIPRINAGIQADFDALMSPTMRYALSRCVDSSRLAPLSVTDFVYGEMDGWGGKKIIRHHFVHVIPGHATCGTYIPGIIDRLTT